MIRSNARAIRPLACLLVSIWLLLGLTGCVGGVMANLIHAAKGNKVPAQFEGLQEKRVAVVCAYQSESFGPSPIAPMISDKVGKLLAGNVEKIDVVDQEEISDWMDRNDWDGIDYVSIGKSVKADSVVAIDINGFRLTDGSTMYKGRADIGITVYDVATEKSAFELTPPQIQYPKNSIIHSTDLSKQEFRRRFIKILSNRIARHFYSYDVQEDFAADTTLITP